MLFKKQKPESRPRRSVASQQRDTEAQPSRGRAAPATPRSRGNNQVYSYRASRSQRQEALGRVSPNKAEQISLWKTRLRWLRSTPRIIAMVVVVVLLGMVMRLDSRVTVVPMDDAKGQVFLHSLHTYEEAVQRTFNVSWLNANKLTVNTAQISEDIKKQFPELKTVAISLPLVGSRPVVYVQPAVPALIVSSKGGGTFVVDTDGKALMTGNQVADLDKLKLPVIADDSALAITTGSIALPRSSVSFIIEMVGQLKTAQLSVQSLTLPAGSSELHVRIAGKPYYVKCNLHGNAREEAGTFMAVMKNLETANKTPGEYIDVRVPNRAYYR